MAQINFILLSKQFLIRRAMACFINLQPGWVVTAEVEELDKALEQLEDNHCSILLIDAEYSESDIGVAIDQARQCGRYIVLFSCQNNIKKLISLLPYQANGYLTADTTPQEFIRYINEVLKGKHALCESLVSEMINEIGWGKPGSSYLISERKKLTAREKEILKCLSTGATNRQIAKSLVISEFTVKNHIHNMLGKFKFNNRAELLSFAITTGLVVSFTICCVIDAKCLLTI